MKILFIGNELMAQRLYRAFEKEDINIISSRDVPSISESIETNKSDLVIVDSTIAGAEEICHRICNLEFVPVVLMVNEAEISWKTIGNLNIDGFISTDAGDTEILARINAIYRRSKKTQMILN